MIRQISAYMIANVVSAVFGFALVVVFTRILSPAEYGIYIVGLSVAAMCSALAFGWIKSSIVPFTTHGDGPDVRLTVGWAFIALALVAAVICAALEILLPDQANMLLPAVFLAFGIGIFEFYLESFRARQEIGSYVWATVIRAAGALGISVLFVTLLGMGGAGLLLGIALSYLLTALLYAKTLWQAPRRPPSRALLGQMLAFGLPLTLSGGLFVLQSMLDRLFLAHFMGADAAGLYGASADLVRQIILFPGVAIGTALMPIAMKLTAEANREALDRHMIGSTEVLLAVLLPAVVGLMLVAPGLARLVLGADFQPDAAMLIPIIAVAWLFRSVSYQLLHASFQIARKPRLMIIHGVAILAVNCVGLLVLIPAIGMMGAAWSLLVSEACGVGLGYVLTRRAYRLPLDLRSWSRVAFATLGMAMPVYLIGQATPQGGTAALAVTVTSGVLAYGGMCYGLNIAGLRSALRRRQVVVVPQ